MTRQLSLINAKYVASAVRADQYPTDELPEIAFLGRSNVGKSSLINSLCNHKGLARVSNTPGKTQTINFFHVELRIQDGEDVMRKPFCLVDLPGYGFAKTGGKRRDMWSSFISEYVTASPRLAVLCLLIDSRHPGLPIDIDAYTWLTDHGVPLQIIATKTDKLNNSERQKSLHAIQTHFPTNFAPLNYSSLKGTGRSKVLSFIDMAIEPEA